MSDTEALVAIHGYSPEGMEGGRDPEVVWKDRLDKGIEIIDKLKSLDLEIEVAISGAGDYNGKTEAQMIKEFADQEYQEFSDEYDLIMEYNSENTEENVVQLHRIASNLGANMAFVISSRDHVPRIARDWEEHVGPEEDLLISAVGSDKTYAESGKDPYILEAAMYEPFIQAFNQVWKVDSEKYEEAANEVKSVLNKYQ